MSETPNVNGSARHLALALALDHHRAQDVSKATADVIVTATAFEKYLTGGSA